MAEPLLDVDRLSVRFDTDDGPVHAVDKLSFTLGRGEVLGIVGESGCGKSVTCMSLLRLLPETAVISGARDVRRRRPARARRRAQLRAGPRSRDLVRLPGADDVAEPRRSRSAARSARC